MMKRNLTGSLVNAAKIFPQNQIFILLGALILIIPLIATTGQFYHSSFFGKSAPILIFYWPGSAGDIKASLPVWLTMSLIFISYLAGIAFLVRKKSLGKVILIVILVFIISGIVRSSLTHFFGWKESPMPNLAGKANYAIISLWHNPIWEEIVFRGIPLVLLLLVERFITHRRTWTGVWIYLLIPSVICGMYHISGHGIIRFFDTIIIGVAFAWLALRFTFWAPVVMHYMADTMMVPSLDKIPSIPPKEVEWIVQYGQTINTISFLLVIVFLLLIPVLWIYYFRKLKMGAELVV